MNHGPVETVVDYIKAIQSIIKEISERAKKGAIVTAQAESRSSVEKGEGQESDTECFKIAALERVSNKMFGDVANVCDVGSPKYQLFYRGHYNKRKFRLPPSVLRSESESKKEDYYYNEMIIRNPNELQDLTHLQKLVTLQHYSCPTRLLDVTSNPLVALFFACTNAECRNCDFAEEGEVIVFFEYEANILPFDSDKALILSALAKLKYSDKIDIYGKMVSAHKEGRLLKSNQDSIARLYHEIKHEVPSFEESIKPLDIGVPYFVKPIKTNQRIVKQEGSFIICGLTEDVENLEQQLNKIVIARISIRKKGAILKELDSLGINEATLFPEMDKVANYLKNR